jgi:hypothetical protein
MCFGKFRKHNLRFQPNKFEFLRKEVTFLRHKISQLRFEPDTHKIVDQEFPNVQNGITTEEFFRVSRIL